MNNQELSFANPEQDTKKTITVKLESKTIDLLQECAEQDGTTIDELLECFINDGLIEYITC